MLFPAPLAAEPVDAARFEAETAGRILAYRRDGILIGIEEYLRDRRVRWSFADGTCFEGRWYPSGEMICFAYEAYPTDQCWTYAIEAGRLTATFGPGGGDGSVYDTVELDEMVECPGPLVGT